MGLILDTCVVIDAERRHHTVRQILEQIQAIHGQIDIGLSVVTIAELMHGAYRAQSAVVQHRSLAFIDRLCSDVPIYPVTIEIARKMGRIDGEQAAQGFTLSFEDLAIGVTALHLGFDVATRNISHFERIPGLKLVTM